MIVIVIPDIHLKPGLFERASELLKEKKADRAVCLMDIPDDWDQQFNLDLYAQTYDAAISFAKEYPDTLWCYGNHDLCYLWNRRESGYSAIAQGIVCEKLNKLREALPDPERLQVLHRIDNVLFLHGGLADAYVSTFTPASRYNDVDEVIRRINSFGPEKMWMGLSPIWFRPGYDTGKMYKPRKLLQVVGHTPVQQIRKDGNVLSCDVFSTYQDGTPIGSQEFLIVDTVTWDYFGVR